MPSRQNPPPPDATPRRARPVAPAPSAAGPVPLDLALQGGGSHGAFTWGVLDRLLQEERFVLDGVSGTSAGALNAVVMATGLARGGRDGARAALAAFWRDVARTGECFGGHRGTGGWWDPKQAAGMLNALPWMAPLTEWAWRWPTLLTSFASPYQFNPLGLNPLRDVAERHVDIAAVRAAPLRVFVTATSVHTGQAEVFTGDRLSLDAVLASACLPHLFRAVEIDGVPYWDGGYTGNPALWPLVYETRALDVLLVKINPIERTGTPDTPMEIADRVSEITFNAGLTGELRAIAFVQRLLREERLEPARYKDLRLHMVHDEEQLAALGPRSKLDTGWDFLQSLHAMGHARAEAWLAEHGAAIGVRPTLDIEATFLRRRGPQAAQAVRRAVED